MLMHAKKERKTGILSEEKFNEYRNHLVIKVCLHRKLLLSLEDIFLCLSVHVLIRVIQQREFTFTIIFSFRRTLSCHIYYSAPCFFYSFNIFLVNISNSILLIYLTLFNLFLHSNSRVQEGQYVSNMMNIQLASTFFIYIHFEATVSSFKMCIWQLIDYSTSLGIYIDLVARNFGNQLS